MPSHPLDKKIVVIFANMVQMAAIFLFIFLVGRKFGSEASANFSQIQNIATLLSFVSLGGFHFRLPASRSGSDVYYICKNITIFLAISVATTFFIFMSLYFIGLISSNFILGLVWALGLSAIVITQYGYNAINSYLKSGFPRIVYSSIIILATTSLYFGFFEFQTVISMIASTTAILGILYFLKMVSEMSEQPISQCFSDFYSFKFSNLEWPFILKTLPVVALSNFNTSSIFIFKDYFDEDTLIAIIFFLTRLVSVSVQVLGNPLSQWLVNDVAKNENKRQYGLSIPWKYFLNTSLFSLSAMIVAFIFIEYGGSILFGKPYEFPSNLQFMIAFCALLQVWGSIFSVLLISRNQAKCLWLCDICRLLAILGIFLFGKKLPTPDLILMWYIVASVYYGGVLLFVFKTRNITFVKNNE